MIVSIENGGVAFVCGIEDDLPPQLLHFGEPLDLDAFDLPAPERSPWSPGTPAPLSLFPQYGFGFFGEPALLGASLGGSAETDFRLVDVDAATDRVTFALRDPVAALAIELRYALSVEGVLTANAELRNEGSRPYALRRLSALQLPVPAWASEAMFFEGGVHREGHLRRVPLIGAKLERVTRGGRPGHDWSPFLFCLEPGTTDERGRALMLHLGHNGNSAMAVEGVDALGRQAYVAEWLAPDEGLLAPGEAYRSPPCHAAVSQSGLNGLSARLHPFVRRRTGPGARPVQLNSWEAVYLQVDEGVAMALADGAASLGVERFVLDDGWYMGRHTDGAGLGDWRPDPTRFPRGLGPLATHVRALGLEFGLWVEPEMVNPDSNLYRAHPDWVISLPGRPRPEWRNQLVLDLTRQEVAEHVLSDLRRLLTDHPISYLKWDQNRPLFPAAGKASAQARAVLAIMGRLRGEFPHVAIETCASGGGRLDYATLGHCDRMWPSDNTDPIERVRIQRAASVVFPPEFAGTHVGGTPNPTTERGTPIAFRCLTSLFGHFGLELDPRLLTESEREVIRRAIDLFKAERAFMADAHLRRISIDTPGVDAQILVAPDQSRALLRVLQASDVHPGSRAKVRVQELRPDLVYRVEELVLEDGGRYSRGMAGGQALAVIGLDALPPFGSMGRLFLLEAA